MQHSKDLTKRFGDVSFGRFQTIVPTSTTMKIARRHRCHLGRDPATKAEPDERRWVDSEVGEERLIYHRDVAHAAQLLRTLRLAITRMVRNEYVEAIGQLIVKVEPRRATGVMMQRQKRPPATSASKIQLHSGQLNGRFSPPHAARHYATSFRAFSGYRLVVPCRNGRTSELRNPATFG